MLTVECIFTLYHTCVEFTAFFFGSFHKCIDHFQICHSWKLDRCILFAGTFHTDRTGCNNNVSALYFRLHSTAGSDPDKCIRSASIKFFHCDRSGRSADSGGCHTYLHSIQCSGICYIFPVICYKNRIVKILCDLFTAFRISRQDNVTSYFSFCHLNVILSACIF